MKKRKFLNIFVSIGIVYAIMRAVARFSQENDSIDDDNPYIQTDTKKATGRKSAYETIFKPLMAHILSFCGIIVLSPLYALITIAIKIDDCGPVFFSQKRIGKDKAFFMCHKFRSMRVDAPHDMPTHQLDDPDKYLTKVGKILRKTSLDELPQLWDIFRGRMSVIGPRPALWNQGDLVAERDKYGANDIMPGLTGLAQIKGRDELEIPEKARLDGIYTAKLHEDGLAAFLQDASCFLGTVKSVLNQDGVVEGGTGAIDKGRFRLRSGVPEIDPEIDWGFRKTFRIDKNRSARVLITGANSYIGTSFEEYARHFYPNIEIHTLDMKQANWRESSVWTKDWDAIFHVAGVAHADVGKATDSEIEQYYKVNTDLAIDVAKKGKEEGVRQFIFMSSMIIYGDASFITADTPPAPDNFYGDSKWQADKAIRALSTNEYHVAVLRAPMIYGRGSKGNYPTLAKFAKKVPVFPKYNNKRSMIYIENLCEFVSLLALSGEGGVYFPQNDEYSNTGKLMGIIAETYGKHYSNLRILSPLIEIAKHVPGKLGNLAHKAFGNSYYDKKISIYKGLDYQAVGLEESIKRTESNTC